jgi:adenylate cyclase
MPRGLAKANCVQFFYEFVKALARREPYYLKRYGLVPGFRAGAHFGLVVVTEVGEIKSEIVFHGDVLNTTARIQGLCSSTGEDLLLSEGLAARLTFPPALEAAALGEHELKGKARAVAIVAVRQVATGP